MLGFQFMEPESDSDSRFGGRRGACHGWSMSKGEEEELRANAQTFLSDSMMMNITFATMATSS